MESNNTNNEMQETVKELMDNEVIQAEEATKAASEEVVNEAAERVEEQVGVATETDTEEIIQEEQVGTFTEKLIPLMNKAEKNIRKGVGQAKDIAKKANDEYIVPAIDKVGASVQSEKAKEFSKKINPKILAIAGAALLAIIALIIIIGGGRNDSEKIALRYVQAQTEVNQSELRKVVEPRVVKHIENTSPYSIFAKMSSEQEAMLKEMRKEMNLSYTIKGHEELSEYEVDGINAYFCELLGIGSFDAKEAVSYTVNAIGRAYGDKIDESIEIVLMKVNGKWYIAKADGSWIDYMLR